MLLSLCSWTFGPAANAGLAPSARAAATHVTNTDALSAAGRPAATALPIISSPGLSLLYRCESTTLETSPPHRVAPYEPFLRCTRVRPETEPNRSSPAGPASRPRPRSPRRTPPRPPPATRGLRPLAPSSTPFEGTPAPHKREGPRDISRSLFVSLTCLKARGVCPTKAYGFLTSRRAWFA